MWGAYKGHIEISRLLLEKGANPNITGQVSTLRAILFSVFDFYACTCYATLTNRVPHDLSLHIIAQGSPVYDQSQNIEISLLLSKLF